MEIARRIMIAEIIGKIEVEMKEIRNYIDELRIINKESEDNNETASESRGYGYLRAEQANEKGHNKKNKKEI